jgi:hypothetical protein
MEIRLLSRNVTWIYLKIHNLQKETQLLGKCRNRVNRIKDTMNNRIENEVMEGRWGERSW